MTIDKCMKAKVQLQFKLPSAIAGGGYVVCKLHTSLVKGASI